MSMLKDRIAEAMRRHPALTPAEIARACEVQPPSVWDWINGKTKTLKSDTARLGAKLFGCDQNWLATGVGTPNWVEPASPSPKGVPSPERPHTRGSGDHFLSLITPTIDPITIPWESIVSMQFSENMPPLFRVFMPDDALAPDYPKGLELHFSTAKTPQATSLVLVRDAHGQPHIREYRQGDAPGQWKAAALNRSFKSFESQDGLKILAVATLRGMT